jgi:hypothetical protein
MIYCSCDLVSGVFINYIILKKYKRLILALYHTNIEDTFPRLSID